MSTTIKAPGAIKSSSAKILPSDIHWESFGQTVRYAAAAGRVRPELLLAYLTAVIGGMSGLFARIRGIIGEDRHPSISLTLSVEHSSCADTLTQMVVDPAIWYQDCKRRISQYRFPDEFAHHASQPLSPFAETQKQYAAMMEPNGSVPLESDLEALRRDLLRHRQRYQPSTIIVAPRPENFDALRGEVFDEFALIFDTTGQMIRKAISGGAASRPWCDMLDRIAAAASAGIDQPRGPGGLPTLHQNVCTRTPFLVHLPGDTVSKALQSASPRSLLQAGLIIPATRIKQTLEAKFLPEVGKHLRRISSVVEGVTNRRLADEQIWQSCVEAGEEFAIGVEAFHDRLDNLPHNIRPFARALPGLPQRLLWTALELDGNKTCTATNFASGALQAANWCLDHHVELISSSLKSCQHQQLVKEAIAMIEKLDRLRKDPPCTIRKLSRCYSDQRRERHEPALDFLCAEGVVERDGNSIAFLDPDPLPEWLQGRGFIHKN